MTVSEGAHVTPTPDTISSAEQAAITEAVSSAVQSFTASLQPLQSEHTNHDRNTSGRVHLLCTGLLIPASQFPQPFQDSPGETSQRISGSVKSVAMVDLPLGTNLTDKLLLKSNLVSMLISIHCYIHTMTTLRLWFQPYMAILLLTFNLTSVGTSHILNSGLVPCSSIQQST